MLTCRLPPPLLTPLQWTANSLLRMARSYPPLGLHLLEADARRLHVLAFALAHQIVEKSGDPASALILSCKTSREIIRCCIGPAPPGLTGALGRLGSEIIDAEAYRRLAEIFSDPMRSRLLLHRRIIHSSDIATLAALPSVLCRRAILDAFEGDLDWIDGFAIAVGFLARLTDIEARLGRVSNPAALRGAVSDSVKELPLPPYLPPAAVGSLRSVDQPRDLRRLGRQFANCMGSFTREVMDGLVAIYIGECGGTPIVCLVRRKGRLGWFMEDVRQSANRPVPPLLHKEIDEQFSFAGIPPVASADALIEILGWTTLRRRQINRRVWRRNTGSCVSSEPPF
jgi:hypothetical protein